MNVLCLDANDSRHATPVSLQRPVVEAGRQQADSHLDLITPADTPPHLKPLRMDNPFLTTLRRGSS